MKCRSCGELATRKCIEDADLLCGHLLCKRCVHIPSKHGGCMHTRMKPLSSETLPDLLDNFAKQIQRGLHLQSGEQHFMLTPTIAYPQSDKLRELKWRLTLFTDSSHHIGHLFYTNQYQALLALRNSDGCLSIDGSQFIFEFPLIVVEIV